MADKLRDEINGNKKCYRRQPFFCVIGAGNGGLAMAGYLALHDFSVNIWTRDKDKMEALAAARGIEVEGKLKGFGELNKIDVI